VIAVTESVDPTSVEMSSPDGSAVAASSTTMPSSVEPADRAEAK